MLQSRESILQLTDDLVRVESVVNTPGEIDAAHYLFNHLQSFAYFQEHPEHLTLSRTVRDEIERYNVLAFVEGTKEASSKTVILMGHIDTVGIEDYNHLKNKACDPPALMEALHSEPLPELIREQLESGDWHFGRGVLDMKSGVASHVYLLKYYSEHPEELAGNLVLLAECDEEDSSHGVLSSLLDLKKWREEHGFEYIALINSDFVAPRYEGDPNRYIYKGTVGKLLPSFYITGYETHAGSAFEGLDPNFIAAELTRQISYNPDLCDEAYGETPVPPVSLKQTDFKPTYTIQTALSAYVYYNFFIHTWSPKQVLAMLKEQAEIAFENALALLRERHRRFCERSGQTWTPLPWKARVLIYEDMKKELVAEHGEAFLAHMKQFKEQLLQDKSLDVRMFSARVVEEEVKWLKDRNPAIILFYSSLYSPRIELVGKDEREQKLIEALEQAVATVQPDYEHPIVTRNFFPYVCDMSCVALSDDEEGILAIEENNPSWGSKHYVNYQDIRDINVPCINIGPYGYDAHNRFERMEITYSTEVVPSVTNEIIKRLLR
ncbi:M20/M25/M40 family metallo-hydrolase [Brevibacillus parabrevis]|jgi:Arginine degradation protein (predicted deacylase)|uniref:M20/M25/M40 family metallo-hydrolase n=1 Tax=Brevibacillus parabrevis TaxID=54914 RepID=UPI0023806BA7|nr:M20/M25/M40 family metallo-hydrolase [Brevibacillus parabrevis]MED2255805.1 M20/M25/M40 family metallo-hydrolase [Brevibacillus parabrevis]WDV95317.1 M20/M25/M40 family metallo-hydrolase [Brevibacillus parabrevis]